MDLIRSVKFLSCSGLSVSSDGQEIAMAGVGDGQDDAREPCRLGGQESAADGLEGCAGGENVIDDQNLFAFDGFGILKSESIANVGVTGFLGSLSSLLLGVADAAEGLDEGML